MTNTDRFVKAVAKHRASQERLWRALSMPPGPEREQIIWDEMTRDCGRWWEEPEVLAPSEKREDR